MASILDRYGIKEVANVYFEALAEEGDAGIKEGDIVEAYVMEQIMPQ